MTRIIKKGTEVNISKDFLGINKLAFGLGWEELEGEPLDLDASVFMLNDTLHLPAKGYFVYYNNLVSPDAAITHTGDNRNGDADGDDEKIICDLSKIDDAVESIYVTVTIHTPHEVGKCFGLLKEAYIRLINEDTGEELLMYDLDEDFPVHAGMVFGKLSRSNNDWIFTAVGEGNGTKGLKGFIEVFA